MEYAHINKRTLEIIAVFDEAGQMQGVINRAALPRDKYGALKLSGIKKIPVAASETAAGNVGFEYTCPSGRYAVRAPIDRERNARARARADQLKAIRRANALLAKHGVTPEDLKAELFD